MALPATETLHPAAKGLDDLPAQDVLTRLLDAQSKAVAAVASALPAIAEAAQVLAETIRAGGRIVYAGAGSSALMANADGMELPGTFGIDPDRIVLLMAGGLPVDARMPGDTEDDIAEAARAAAVITARDAVIAVTASGRTPYPLEVARIARERGAKVIAIANNPGAAIFDLAGVAICLPTPPEVIAGSTRMGAGTAQKVALNMLSTLMAVRLGEVHDGYMVGLLADNNKLRGRACGMVAAIAGVDMETARSSLAASGGAVKPAVLLARGFDAATTANLLSQSAGNLRAALALADDFGTLDGKTTTTNQGSIK